MSPIYCTQCGAPNVAGAIFCSKCGQRISGAVGAPLGDSGPSRAMPAAANYGHAAQVPSAGRPAPAVRKSVLTGSGLVLAALLGVGVYALTSSSRPAATQIVQNARAEAEAQVLAAPSRYLQASDLKYYDQGIINDYRQVVQLSVLNRSTLAVQNLAGQVDWYDKSARLVGSIPLSLKGSIAAGATQIFSTQSGTLENGTIKTNATNARIRFTQVATVE